MGQYDYSNYPDAIDAYGTLPIVRDGVDEIVAKHNNSLRSAILSVQQTLGVNPQGAETTVRARLDTIGDAATTIAAHLVDPTAAHPASAISVLDVNDNYASLDVEGALIELSAALPAQPNVIGEPATLIPNSGVPDFVAQTGSLFLLRQTGPDVLQRTQPIDITGIHVIEVGTANGSGQAQIKLSNHSPATICWMEPGSAVFGTGVDISGLAVGEAAIIPGSDPTKKIRIIRTAAALPLASPITEFFYVLRLNAATGAISMDGVGIVDSSFITRTAMTSTGETKEQFVISGTVYPADKGTLVLQRKLYYSDTVTQFEPIAVLQLDAVGFFDENLRSTGQPAYAPSFTSFDTISLYDRYPVEPSYAALDANGSPVYTSFAVNQIFSPFQLAKYKIPVSNPNVVGATLQASTGFKAEALNDQVKASAYRVVHYLPGQVNFSGNPASNVIYSIYDTAGASDTTNNNVRAAVVFVDSDQTRPAITTALLNPAASSEVSPKIVSGIHYYNTSDDLFNLSIQTDTAIFSKAYNRAGILTLASETLDFPAGAGYGTSIDVTETMNSVYSLYSDANLPQHEVAGQDFAYYIMTGGMNPSRMPYPKSSSFSANAFVSVTPADPFGSGNRLDAYGDEGTSKILINACAGISSAEQEFFIDETYRNGTTEVYDFELDYGQLTSADGPGAGGTLDAWDSTAPLASGELQVGGLSDQNVNSPGLIYPRFDYEVDTYPDQQAGTDYSVFSTINYVMVGDGPKIQTSGSGSTWHNQTTAAGGTATKLYEAIYGGGLFVAVGDNGDIQTSTDCVNWMHRTADAGYVGTFYGVGYNASSGHFIAVGSGGEIQRSSNGTAWTHIASGSGYAGTFSTVSYLTANIWVAISNAGEVQTSSDNGITWIHRGTVIKSNALVWSGALLVSVGISGEIKTSTNGVAWFSRTADAGYVGDFGCVTYGNGMFVAGGTSGEIQTSLDGTTWTHQTNAGSFAGSFTSATYYNGLYILAGSDGEIQISANGTTWAHRDPDGSMAGQSFRGAAGQLVESGVDSTYQRVLSLGRPINSGSLLIRSSGDYPISYAALQASNASRALKIEIKIPGNDSNATGWLDIGKDFVFGQFDDGDGCCTYATGTAGSFNVFFTFGQRDTSNTGGSIAVRVTYFGSKIATNKHYILSGITLQS